MLIPDIEPAGLEIEGVYLSGREQVMLMFIVEYYDMHHSASTNREILIGLNSRMHPMPGRSKRYSGLEQVRRVTRSLQGKELLLPPKANLSPGRVRRARNLIPMPHARRIAYLLSEKYIRNKDRATRRRYLSDRQSRSMHRIQ